MLKIFPIEEQSFSTYSSYEEYVNSLEKAKNQKGTQENVSNSVTGRLTVVLDIDETLVHTQVISREIDYDREEKEEEVEEDDSFFLLHIQGLVLKVTKRPFLAAFLQEASKKFDLIAFTAGSEDYAQLVLEKIDPNRTFFQQCLFRQHCLFRVGESFVKDLRILNRNLSRTVLVDNNAFSFLPQLENGIPISSFFGDFNDQALVVLHNFLDSLQNEPDVRSVLQKLFRLEVLLGDVARKYFPT